MAVTFHQTCSCEATWAYQNFAGFVDKRNMQVNLPLLECNMETEDNETQAE